MKTTTEDFKNHERLEELDKIESQLREKDSMLIYKERFNAKGNSANAKRITFISN